ncbi:hypothetical protein KKH3_32720 [Pectobacterium actinidiae]|nr:hypothetical protein KKH3_32720 [Pectobacterium actinidiae]
MERASQRTVRDVRECEKHNEENDTVRYAVCVSSRFYAVFSLFQRARRGFVVFVFLICESNLFLAWYVG